jgi:chromosomal replication initiation ATPase DnaA
MDLNHLMSSRRGFTNEPRNVAIYLCRRLSGETLTNIGKQFGLNNYGSVSSVVSLMKKTLRRDARLRKRVARLEHQLRKQQNRT